MRNLFYLLLTIFFVFLWFYLVDVGEVVVLFGRIHWVWVFLAISLGVFQEFLTAIRLKTLLSVLGKIPFFYIWALAYVGAAASMILQFSGGGLTMVHFIAKKMKVSHSKVFAILLIDFLLGVSFTLFLALFGIFFFAKQEGFNVDIRLLFFPAAFFIFAFLAGFALLRGLSAKFTWLRRVSKILESFQEGLLLAIRAKDKFGKAILLTGFVLLVGYLNFYLYFKAFEVSVPFLPLVLAGSILAILGLIPGAPTKLGQYEFLGLLTLPYLLDLSKERVFTVLLFSHVVGITVVLLGGWLAVIFLRLDQDLPPLFSRKEAIP